MKVTITRKGRSLQDRNALFEPNGIEKELRNQGEQEHVPMLQALAELLRKEIPANYLARISLSELVQNLRHAGNFLQERHEEIKVEIVAQPEPGHYFIFANCPNANHIFFSLQEYLYRKALHFRVICHPIFAVKREQGRLATVESKQSNLPLESFIWLELERAPARLLEELSSAIKIILGAAITAYRDRSAMLARFDDLSRIPGLTQYSDLYQWLSDDNFIPVTARSYLYTQGGGVSQFKEEDDRALGLNEYFGARLSRSLEAQPLAPESIFALIGHSKNFDHEPTTLRCPLHRMEKLTYLGFREDLGSGQYREHCFLGFYTQKSIDETSYSIPALRARIDAAQQRLGILQDSHNYRKTIQIISSFPKIEMFLMEDVELERLLHSFTQMHRQAGVKVILAPNTSESALTLLLIMPNDYYRPEHIERMENYLRRYLKADAVESRLVHMASDYLSLHVNLQLKRKEVQLDLLQLEMGLTRIALPWKLKFRELLEKRFAADSNDIYERYSKAFHKEYRRRTKPRFAVRDLRNIETLLSGGRDVFDLWGPFFDSDEYFLLQYYSLDRSLLNDLMPFLQNLDLCVLQEIDSDLQIDARDVYIKSFAIRSNRSDSLPFKAIKSLLLDTLSALRSGNVENDLLHKLLPLTGLSWREIDVFRAYRNYYFQLGNPFTKTRVADTLCNNAAVASLLYRYFEGRFKPRDDWSDPMVREMEVLSPIRQELVTALDEVSDPNEDKILRTLFNLIDSTIRTNFFLRCNNDSDDYFISFKISSLGVIEMPSPRPLYEVYVHAAWMEGVHMRGGKVARGGIRWSDRPDDFRTEVLGLVKAQMTKNAVIVPEGSKGGFVTKQTDPDREKMGAIVKLAYQTLMRGLLDMTDNRVGDDIVRPEGLLAYDDEDPYLVVAADKGTAHLPDTANAVSESYDFWLGDAFASGGSHGYDHKTLGITARGAWESVKRLFREMGTDIQSEPFTVVGIGDMSGDVFGNGMLLSRQIKLLAAFDHRHIFLDPNPDPEESYVERERLFRLPRSSWEDYNPGLISKGGGIYSRQLKEIPITPEVADWLGVRPGTIDVPGLIRLLLKAQVDLLWNGGIGTYVKSSQQSNDDAGDRANDPVRIDGNELRARVVGEGGNLGLTQLGRIEYALNGGLINTDAIDNSAGVDSSDHEVNLKILLRLLRQQGKVKDLNEGYALLDEIEKTVCVDVLANNYNQTLSISLDLQRCHEDTVPHLDLIDRLTRSGLLDRRGEFLPSRKDVSTRPVNSLLRPELSVLLAYSKMFLYSALLDGALPDNAVVNQLLYDYFPEEVVERYRDSLEKHPLERQITATMLTNRVVDQAGSAFLHHVSTATGKTWPEVANAYIIFDDLLDGKSLRQAVFALDNKIPSDEQHQLLLKLEDTLSAFCQYALSNDMVIPATSQDYQTFKQQLDQYRSLLPEVLPEEEWAQCLKDCKGLEQQGMTAEVAQRFAELDYYQAVMPLVALQQQSDYPLDQLASIKIFVASQLDLGAIEQRLNEIPVTDSWDRRARQSVAARLQTITNQLIERIVLESGDHPQRYLNKRRSAKRAFDALKQSLLNDQQRNFNALTVLLSAMEELLAE